MRFRRVHHVALNVTDVQEARAFYVDLLELSEIPRPDFGFPGLWLDLGDQQLHLFQSDDSPAHGQHFAFEVEDIESTLSDLAERGVKPVGRLDIPGAGRQAFIRDPFGNMIEINEPN